MANARCGGLILGGLCGGLLVLGASGVRHAPARAADRPVGDRAAVERARETVRMLDDLYKGYVVNITATYVDAQEKTPAAKVTQKVFRHMADKGWHTARLVDATGEPVRKENLPRTEFEKKAVAQIKQGKPYYDEIGTSQQGKLVLRAATIVPAVMKQCTTCHAGKKEGNLLGALVYEVPIKLEVGWHALGYSEGRATGPIPIGVVTEAPKLVLPSPAART
jgi:hypothetical protein